MSSLLWEAAIQQAQQAGNASSEQESQLQAAQLAQLSDVAQSNLPPIPLSSDLLPPPADDSSMNVDQPAVNQEQPGLQLADEEKKAEDEHDEGDNSDDDGSPKQAASTVRSLNGNYYDRKRSGHRQIMAAVAAYLKDIVVGDSISADYTECMVVFLNEFLNRRENLEIRERIAEFSVKPVIQSIRAAYDAAMDRDKPQMASLVTGHFTRSELSRLGMPISSHSFSAANRHIATRGVGVKVAPPKLPPKRKPLSKQARDELFTFLEANSYASEKHKVRVPKPNRPEGSKETESMFCRQLNATRAQLRRNWKMDPNHAQLAQSTFNREIARFRVFKYHVPQQKQQQHEHEHPPMPMQAHPAPHHNMQQQQQQYSHLSNLQQLHQQQAVTQQVFNQFQVPNLPHQPLPQHQQLSQHQQIPHPQQQGQQHPGVHQPHPGHPSLLLGGMAQLQNMPTLSQSMQY